MRQTIKNDLNFFFFFFITFVLQRSVFPFMPAAAYCAAQKKNPDKNINATSVLERRSYAESIKFSFIEVLFIDLFLHFFSS